VAGANDLLAGREAAAMRHIENLESSWNLGIWTGLMIETA
jgi:hypothetical protein